MKAEDFLCKPQIAGRYEIKLSADSLYINDLFNALQGAKDFAYMTGDKSLVNASINAYNNLKKAVDKIKFDLENHAINLSAELELVTYEVDININQTRRHNK